MLKERRSEPRISVDQSVVVTIIGSSDREPFEGTVVDLSRSGLGVRIPYAIGPGSRIEIRWSRGRVIAEVRNCLRMSSFNYRVGVKTSEIAALAGIVSEIATAVH